MRPLLLIAALLVAAPLACDPTPVPTTPSSTASTGPAAPVVAASPAAPATAAGAPWSPAEAARAANAFAAELHGRLRADTGNLFYAPVSIATALGMAAEGARGATAAQMTKVLHTAGAPPGGGAALLATLVGSDKGPALRVANRLFGAAGTPFERPFLDLLQGAYKAPLEQLDYAKDVEGARARINAWAEKETEQRIKDLIPPGVLTAETRLVLANAIYFKGAWATKLDAALTRPEPFFVDGAQPKDVPTMHQRATAGYAETPSAQVLELAYAGAGPKLAMDIVLPKDKAGLAAVEDAYVAGGIGVLVTGMAQRDHIDLSLPRFTMTKALELSSALGAMGMPLAFGNQADFSGMSREPLKISKVVHKAFVEVNEEGTEAAAATGAVMVPRALVRGTSFKVDHPFLFVIRDTGTGAVLFVGRVTDPG